MKLKTEIEDECEYQVYIQSVEIEQTFEKFKKELKRKGETVEYKKLIKEQCSESLKCCNETLREEMKSRDGQINDMKKENMKLKRSLEKMKFHLSCKEAEIEDLKLKLDQVEQNQYERNVRIVGFPEEEAGSSDLNNIQKMAKTAFDMSVEETDIAETYRLGKLSSNKKTRDLIVKFKKKSMRDQFFNSRKKLMLSEQRRNIFINDQLTDYRANTFFAARKLVKAQKLHSAWTQRGNILVRKEESDKPTHIRSHKELAEFIGEPLKTTDEKPTESSDED